MKNTMNQTKNQRTKPNQTKESNKEPENLSETFM